MEDGFDRVFKALPDSGRRLLLDRLHADNGQTLGQLCERMDMTRQAVSKHLKVLEESSLVVPIWRGREKLHYLNPVPIHEIAERWIGKYERHRLSALAELKKGLEAKNHRAEIRLRHFYRDDAGEAVAGAHRWGIHRAVLVRLADRVGLDAGRPR